MKRNCPIKLDQCVPGTKSFDSPITNVSAEAPDPLVFTNTVWPTYDPFDPPDLSDGPDPPATCETIAASTNSQAEADLLAFVLGLDCNTTHNPGGGGGDHIFVNSAQSATVTCLNGATFTFTVPTGFISRAFEDVRRGESWAAAMNASLLAYAQQQASAALTCPERQQPPVGPGPNPPGKVPDSPLITDDPGWLCVGETLDLPDDYYSITNPDQGYGFSVLGITGLPPGISLVKTGLATATLRGVATVPGVYEWTIDAQGFLNPYEHVFIPDILFVFGISNAGSVPTATVGTFYSFQLQAVGGTAPYTFQATSALPAGLLLASDGTISGTPTTAGSTSFTVQVTDDEGGTCKQTVTLIVLPIPSVCPDWSTLPWGVPNEASLGAATKSFTPNNTTSASFDFWVKAPNTGAGDSGFTQNEAGSTINPLFQYNGSGCNCKLTYTATVFNVLIPQSLLLTIDYSPDGGFSWFNLVNAPAVFNVPDVILFSLPDTLGSPIMIRVQASAQIPGLPPFGHQEIELIGTIANV